jgi:arsenate reductase
MKIKIYHNSRCRKSRETLGLIREAGHEPEIIEYIQNPPSESELKELLEGMGKKPIELIRKGEEIFKSKFKGKTYSDAKWIKIMVENPKLIERPIVVKGKKVILGRPPENVKEIL